jgi:prepilin-type N-terminal cleavage/methylation domain-containing protein
MNRRAITLIEVLLTIVILGLIMAWAMPELDRLWESRSLVESADRLRTLIVRTRAQAMLDGRRYRITFPGAPDPNDPFADKEIDVPFETKQPEVEWQRDPLVNPEWWDRYHSDWADSDVLYPGVRCVAVMPGRPSFDVDPQSPISGPSITEGEAPFHRVNFNHDGTSDWATFVLTDLPFDIDVEEHHVGRIINVIVDGRTGEAWLQRAMRTEEVEMMKDFGAQPVLHMDFTRPDRITEDNILQVQYGRGGKAVAGRARRSE